MPTIEELSQAPVALIREVLPPWVATHISAPPEILGPMEAQLRAHLAAASDAAIEQLLAEFRDAGAEYRLYPANPVGRTLTRTFMHALTPTWTLDGRDHLERFLTTGPSRRMIVCNHLSYTDTQITDSIFVLAGRGDVADRLVAVAGPKVYTDPWRRMAAISLNTRKTAQSSAVATEQAALSPRELAMVAFETLADCERLMDQGYIVLLYPEGTRSRTGRLGPFLRAASRYLALPGVQVLPMVQTGTESIYPIDSKVMYVAPVRVAFGEAFEPAAYPGKTGPLTEAHTRMEALLPEAWKPQAEQGRIA